VELCAVALVCLVRGIVTSQAGTSVDYIACCPITAGVALLVFSEQSDDTAA